MSRSIIAFVDLLGTGYLANHEPRLYQEQLSAFQYALTSGSALLGTADRVFCFSDCAYIQTTRTEAMAAYLRHVRKELLDHGVYLKGAVAYGRLGASDVHRKEQIMDPSVLAARQKVISGTAFGADVAGIYAAQDSLKGIGLRLAPDLTQDKHLKKNAVTSCHLPHPNNSGAEPFYDLRFEKAELRVAVLDAALRNCLKAHSKARKAGRYYVSFFTSFIRSIAWEKVSLAADNPEDPGGTLLRRLITGYFDRHLGDLAGTEYIVYTVLDEVYGKECDHEVTDAVERYVLGRKKYIKMISDVPEAILPQTRKDHLLERKLSYPVRPHPSGRAHTQGPKPAPHNT